MFDKDEEYWNRYTKPRSSKSKTSLKKIVSDANDDLSAFDEDTAVPGDEGFNER